MKNIIPLISFLTLLFAQYEIEGRWHLVGYEDLVMYQFVDTEPFADAGCKYTKGFDGEKRGCSTVYLGEYCFVRVLTGQNPRLNPNEKAPQSEA